MALFGLILCNLWIESVIICRMTDKMTSQQRHYCMSQIKSKNTRPEMLVRKWLWHNGYRYRLCDRSLPGSPDIVLPKLRTAIFVNGCFWHGHDKCGNFRLPKSNVEFWKQKIERNKLRDLENYRLLRERGWHVLVVWECQLKKGGCVDTLYALTVRLSQILLSIHKPSEKPYSPVYPSHKAADSCEEYGK